MCEKLSGITKIEDKRAIKQVVALLSAPLKKYNDIVTAPTLSNYPRVMDHLDNGTNKVMAMVIIQSIMKNDSCILTADKLDEEDFSDEQNSVARLIHMLHNDDPEEMFKKRKDLQLLNVQKHDK